MYGIQKDGDIQQIAGNSHIVADDALSTTSENPIQNKVVTNALADVVTAANEAETSTTTPRDADLLGGHAPSYFATNDSLSAINDKIGKQYSEFNSTVLNNLKTNGMYTGYFVSGATTSTGWGFLLVGGQGTSVVVQTALVSNGKQYTRYFYNNAWTAWT